LAHPNSFGLEIGFDAGNRFVTVMKNGRREHRIRTCREG
jgi:hypothetical protein